MKRLLLFIFILLPFAIYGQRTDRRINNNIWADTIKGRINLTSVLYVAKNGNDANTGTIGNPFLTIGTAINAASSGTTILIMPGTYTENITFKAGVNISAPVLRGVTIIGNHIANFAGTVVIENCVLSSATGVTLTISGAVSTNIQFYNSSSNSGTGDAIVWTNTNSSSKLTLIDCTVNVATSGATARCFYSTTGAVGSVIAGNVSFNINNPDNICLAIGGAISFTHTSDAVIGQTTVNNTASHTSTMVTHTTATVPSLVTNSSGMTAMLNCIQNGTAVPMVTGYGAFAEAAIIYPSSGKGTANTLNANTGAYILNMCSLKLRSGTPKPVPQNGLMEYDSIANHLYFTIGSTKYQLDQQSTPAPISNFLSWNAGNYYEPYSTKAATLDSSRFYKGWELPTAIKPLTLNGIFRASNIYTGNGNSCYGLGLQTLINNTIGTDNCAIGRIALTSNTTGNSNAAIGTAALTSNISGNYNTAFGESTLILNQTGSNNLAIGNNSLTSNVSGNYNSAFGVNAGVNCLGSYNVFLGASAGYFETGSNKLYISNNNSATPLIYGEFNNNILRLVSGNFTLASDGSSNIPTGSTYKVNNVSINSMVKDTVVSNSGVYGECHYLVGSTFTVVSPATNTTYEITGYNGSSQNLRSVTAQTNGLTINSKGYYRISFNCRITTGNINDIGLMVNSSKDNDGGFDTFGYTGSVSGSRILYLNSGDLVKLILTTDNTTQVDINIKSASLVITKIIN